MKAVVLVAFLLILAALFSALYFLYKDRGQSKRMVHALTVRVALSIALVLFLLLSYWMGWIAPGGLR